MSSRIAMPEQVKLKWQVLSRKDSKNIKKQLHNHSATNSVSIITFFTSRRNAIYTIIKYLYTWWINVMPLQVAYKILLKESIP